MGFGARHDTIENKVDHLNWEKNISQGKFLCWTTFWMTESFIGDTLARKLIVAIAERDKQVGEFKEVDSTLRKHLRKEWQAQIDAWRADKTQPNPYSLPGGKSSKLRQLSLCSRC
jgi:hypothetical protein